MSFDTKYVEGPLRPAEEGDDHADDDDRLGPAPFAKVGAEKALVGKKGLVRGLHVVQFARLTLRLKERNFRPVARAPAEEGKGKGKRVMG